MFTSFTLRLVLSLVLGAIAVFSYAPFDIGFIAFISFAGLLFLISNQPTKRAALIGLFWGIGYFLSGVHWVYVSIKQYGELPTIVAILILALFILYLSLYPMLFALLVRLLNRLAPAYSIKQLVILAPCIWQLTEFLRATLLNGFSWLQFGYTQLNLPLSGLLPIVGIHGVNLLFSCLCGLLVYVIYQLKLIRTDKSSVLKAHFFGALSALIFLFIAPMLIKNIAWTDTDTTRQVKITLVQANIAQSLRWNAQQLNNTLASYLSLTQSNLKNSDIIIWSEAAITDFELNQQPYLQALDRLAINNDTAIALGIIDLKRQDGEYEIYNSLIVLGDKQPYQYTTANRYNKHHLVPFGEYIPLESLLKPIARLLNIPMSSMSAGEQKQAPIIMKDFKFLTIICYEAVLSDLVLTNFTADTDFLLTVSNDAWFGNSIGPWQHLQMAKTRALEFGRTLIRSTNNGITTVINPQGQIIDQLPQFTQTTLSTTLSPNTGLTPYARWGNYPYYTVLAFFVLILMRRRKD